MNRRTFITTSTTAIASFSSVFSVAHDTLLPVPIDKQCFYVPNKPCSCFPTEFCNNYHQRPFPPLIHLI